MIDVKSYQDSENVGVGDTFTYCGNQYRCNLMQEKGCNECAFQNDIIGCHMNACRKEGKDVVFTKVGAEKKEEAKSEPKKEEAKSEPKEEKDKGVVCGILTPEELERFHKWERIEKAIGEEMATIKAESEKLMKQVNALKEKSDANNKKSEEVFTSYMEMQKSVCKAHGLEEGIDYEIDPETGEIRSQGKYTLAEFLNDVLGETFL